MGLDTINTENYWNICHIIKKTEYNQTYNHEFISFNLNLILFLRGSFNIYSALLTKKDLSLYLWDNSSYRFPIVTITISGQ